MSAAGKNPLNLHQMRLIPEPRFVAACRDELLPPGLFSPASLVVMASSVSQPVKGWHWAVLHHLRGGSTSAWPSSPRVAAQTGWSVRAMDLAAAEAHRRELCFLRRRGHRTAVQFAPLDWWLREAAGLHDPRDANLAERLLDLYASDPAIVEFVTKAMSGESAPTRPVAAPRPDAPSPGSRTTCADRAPRARNAHHVRRKHLLEAITETPSASAAPSGLDLESEHRGPGPTPSVLTSLAQAEDWFELLGLSRLLRMPEDEEADVEALAEVARDAGVGRLGDSRSAIEALTTTAHQIGKRQPSPRSPLGMFLAEVGRIRARAYRGRPAAAKEHAR